MNALESCLQICKIGVLRGVIRPRSVFPTRSPRLRTHAAYGFAVSVIITRNHMTSNTSFGRVLAYFSLVAPLQRMANSEMIETYVR